MEKKKLALVGSDVLGGLPMVPKARARRNAAAGLGTGLTPPVLCSSLQSTRSAHIPLVQFCWVIAM